MIKDKKIQKQQGIQSSVQNISLNILESAGQVVYGSLDLLAQLSGRGSSRNYYMRKSELIYCNKCRRRAAKAWLFLAIVAALVGGAKGHRHQQTFQQDMSRSVGLEMSR